jgi:signal peptidase I
MMPKLQPKSLLLIDTFTYRFRSPRIGEIVVADEPQTNESIVKRVVATAGDSVAIEDGVLIRNGHAIAEPFATKHNMGGFYFGPVTVPANAVFVLGDNRAESTDSRNFGSLLLGNVKGRLLVSVA